MHLIIPSAILALFCGISSAQGFTQIKIQNPDASAKTDAFATFGMVFKKGDIAPGKVLSLSGAEYQIDAKATHADGSLRHAVLTLKFPSLAANEIKTLSLSEGTPGAPGTALDGAEVLKTDFNAIVSLTVSGKAYTASVRDHLAQAKIWLKGPLCTEWTVTAPVKTAAGEAHPHLHVRFAIRAYAGLKSIRADISVENDWAYEPNPSGITYDASITVGTQEVYTKAGLAHTHHARWRKVFWWGVAQNLHQTYDEDYLFDSNAFPQYDRSVTPDPTALTALKGAFEPMANGNLSTYMPETGAQDGIGPLPHYGALYLLSQDIRARLNVIANGECGGSYQIHFRDKTTDLPVSIDDYPYMTLLGNDPDTKNPKTGKLEAFPAVTNPLAPHIPDDAHQPSIGFLPYIITGDLFHLEELLFWANWNMVEANPLYRGYEKGLLAWGQTRGQAWSLRTLGQAAYITPDAYPMKKYFVDKVANNIEAYINKYPKNPDVNPIGYMEGHYPYSPFGLAPWMDDFFTWSVGYLVQLGFPAALPMAQWKAKFVVGRMMDPDYCWLKAGVYELQVGTSAMVPYKTLKEIYAANFPSATCTGVKMDGYPDSPTGYPANMQPALAMAVDMGVTGAKEAWAKYQTRSPKQDYSKLPQFSVVPNPNPASTTQLNRKRSGMKKDAGRDWYVGLPFAYDVTQPCDVWVELYEPSGKRAAAIPLGRQSPGRKVFRPSLEAVHVGSGPKLLVVKGMEDSREAVRLKVGPISWH
jgi:hypothetical protein